MPRIPKHELLPGDKFGRLTLLEKMDGYKWRCRCECGTERIVRSCHLVTGHTQSCGCSRVNDLTGLRFGMLTVIKRADSYVKGTTHLSRWECKCDCGGEVTTLGQSLLCGDTKSCGCQSAKWATEIHTKHNESHTELYQRWKGIKSRCASKRPEVARVYLNRGITVCEEWTGTDGYEHFRDWALSHGYSPSLTIDRIDNEKGYSPENCRWITPKEQHYNLRTNVWYEYQGKRYLLSQLAYEFGIPESVLRYRLRKKCWDVATAIETPVKHSTSKPGGGNRDGVYRD